MASFRINNNIPKTIVTPEIKTLNIPFITKVDDATDPPYAYIGQIPSNISILGCTAIIKEKLPYAKSINFIITSIPLAIPLIDSSAPSPRIIGSITIKSDEFKGSSIATKNVNGDKEIYVYVYATVYASTTLLELTGTFTLIIFRCKYETSSRILQLTINCKKVNYVYFLFSSTLNTFFGFSITSTS